MWFGVSVLYRSVRSDGEEPLWEETIHIVNAPSVAEVAKHFIPVNECEYEAADGSRVRWVYDGILSVYEIDDVALNSGTEVFSRFLKQSEAISLKNKII